MSLGVLVGFTTAYPFNVWLVSVKLKHGLMTERKTGTKFDVAPQPHHGVQKGRHGEEGPKAAGHEPSPGGRHAGHEMGSEATRPQRLSVAGVTALMLLIGMVAPGLKVNLWLGVKEVGGMIMPSGMIMDFDTPAEAMRDMAAIHPRYVSYVAPVEGRL